MENSMCQYDQWDILGTLTWMSWPRLKKDLHSIREFQAAIAEPAIIYKISEDDIGETAQEFMNRAGLPATTLDKIRSGDEGARTSAVEKMEMIIGVLNEALETIKEDHLPVACWYEEERDPVGYGRSAEEAKRNLRRRLSDMPERFSTRVTGPLVFVVRDLETGVSQNRVTEDTVWDSWPSPRT
jgi:hypothetical protein